MRALKALVLLALAGAAAAVDASLDAPGGLTREETPQFVLFTHDDAIKEDTHELMRSVTDGVVANGCPAVATMFTTSQGTDCELLMDLYKLGYEIADHTRTHTSFLKESRKELENEILGARTDLAKCGVPESAIKGARAPFLEIKPEVWEVLSENGFLYDSSLIEEGTGESLTQGMGRRLWPYDMGKGIPQNCDYFADTQKCDKSARYPGLWQVPMWWLTAANGIYNMDYGAEKCKDEQCVYEILSKNFAEGYDGNRAPFPIFIHSPWLAEKANLQATQRFIKEVAQKRNVYVVTLQQLLAWMQNPIPASQLTPEALGCGNPGGAGGSSASVPAPAPAPAADASTEDTGAPTKDSQSQDEPQGSEDQAPEDSPAPEDSQGQKKKKKKKKQNQDVLQ